MAAYLETLFADVRGGILAAVGELSVDGIFESEHADTVPWGELTLPYAAVVVNLDAAAEWGIQSNAFTATVDIYLVYAQLGGGAGLRAKLEAVRDAFANTERLTKGTTLEVGRVGWGRDLAPNRELAADPTRRAGLVQVRAVVGERP